MRALPLLIALAALALWVQGPAAAGAEVCVIKNAEIPDYPCVEYRDGAFECGPVASRCVCVMFYEDYGSYGSGQCVDLPPMT